MSNNKRHQAMVKLVEQLQHENKVERIPVSQSAQAILDFCNQNTDRDYLITKQGPNPFKPDRPCPML